MIAAYFWLRIIIVARLLRSHKMMTTMDRNSAFKARRIVKQQSVADSLQSTQGKKMFHLYLQAFSKESS